MILLFYKKVTLPYCHTLYEGKVYEGQQILSAFASFGFSCFFSGFLFLTVDGGASCLHIYSDIPESDIIPTRNWFYQDKDQSSLSLGSRDLFCSFIGQFQPKHRHQCHWHCSLRCHGFTISGQLISQLQFTGNRSNLNLLSRIWAFSLRSQTPAWIPRASQPELLSEEQGFPARAGAWVRQS